MFLKNIDIYGSKLDFQIDKRSEFTTNLGGIFTILSACAYIILFNFMAKDLYNKVNPKITEENTYITDSNVNNFTISGQSFLFAIYHPSIIDVDDENYQFGEKLFKYSAIFKEFIVGRDEPISTPLELMKCDEAKYANLFFDIDHAGAMSCLNLTSIKKKNLTNFFYSKAVQSNIIEVSLNYDYDFYNSLNETVKTYLKNRITPVGYFWPELSISPNNFTNPLDIQLNYNKFYLSEDTFYRNNLRLVETVLEQDINYFTDGVQPHSSKIHVAFQFANYPSRKGKTSDLAKFQIYLDGLYTRKLTRVYKKIPEILAEVSGTMDLIILACTYFVGYFTTYNLDYSLVNKFIGYFSKDKNKEDKLVWKYQNYKEFSGIFKNKNLFSKENKEFDTFKKPPNLDMNNANDKKSIIDLNYNKKNEKTDNNQELETQKKYLCDEINRIQTENDRINYVNLEMVAIDINKNNISDNNQSEKNNNAVEKEIYDGSKLTKNLPFSNNENIINQKKNEETSDSFNYSEDNKNDYPYTGFISYYFPICLSKKNSKSNKRLNYTNILQYFSGKLQTHLDFFHYLEYISTIKLLKNSSINEDQEKMKYKYLTKHLYYMRDCDEEHILKLMEQESN